MISVQFCPVNGALKKKIFTVNRTCVRIRVYVFVPFIRADTDIAI